MSDSPISPSQSVFWAELGDDIQPANVGVVTGLWSNNGIKNAGSQFVSLTQAEYDALTPDASTIYFIVEDV